MNMLIINGGFAGSKGQPVFCDKAASGSSFGALSTHPTPITSDQAECGPPGSSLFSYQNRHNKLLGGGSPPGGIG